MLLVLHRLVLQLLRCLLRPLRWIWQRLCCNCFRRLAVSRASTKIPTFTYKRKSRRQRFLKATTPILMALLLLQKPSDSFACSDIITVSGTSTNCITHDNQETCHLESSTTITIQPMSQELCFVLRDKDNHPAAVLTLRVSSVQHKCNKRILFYTRDHKFYSESSHRCYKAGSCQSERCDTTKTNDRLEEFTNSANDAPGFTFCTSSCGCVSCNGCFLCSPSCLFYRYYARPTSPTVYNIFDCPSWTTTVSGSVTLEKERDPPASTTFTLDPARPFRWNTFTFNLASHSSPPIPLFGKIYIENGHITALLPESISNFGHNTAGQLKCQSYDDANKFSCSFSSDVCSCISASYAVSCQCANGDIEKYLKKNPLPIYTQQVMLSQNQGVLLASLTQGTAIQLSITTTDLQWTTRVNKNTCSLKIHQQLRGCYSCLAGGRMTISCHSEPGDELAEITCGSHTAIVRCNPNGQQQEIILHFDESEIKLECNFSCRFGEPQQFVMKGSLSHVSDVLPLQGNAAPSSDRINDDDPMTLLDSAWKWITSAIQRFTIYTAIPLALIGMVLLIVWFKKNGNTKKILRQNRDKKL